MMGGFDLMRNDRVEGSTVVMSPMTRGICKIDFLQ